MSKIKDKFKSEATNIYDFVAEDPERRRTVLAMIMNKAASTVANRMRSDSFSASEKFKIHYDLFGYVANEQEREEFFKHPELAEAE